MQISQLDSDDLLSLLTTDTPPKHNITSFGSLAYKVTSIFSFSPHSISRQIQHFAQGDIKSRSPMVPHTQRGQRSLEQIVRPLIRGPGVIQLKKEPDDQNNYQNHQSQNRHMGHMGHSWHQTHAGPYGQHQTLAPQHNSWPVST